MTETNTTKLCECGCGKPAPLASKTLTSRGWVKGKPIRFVHNHHGVRDVRLRFAEKVSRRDANGCKLWLGAKTQRGYGVILLRDRKMLAHRLAWEIANGPVQDGLYVLHKCDIKPCVNPEHLFLGTHEDNMADMYAKGLQSNRARTRNGRAVLTELQVESIRFDKRFQKDIAVDYGIAQSHVSRIKRGESWPSGDTLICERIRGRLVKRVPT